MNKPDGNVRITIDGRAVDVQRGATILNAAETNDIYIPTLCAHKDLTPYGGCRMCIVEVEGMRGFPTACTTPVDEGMVIRTHTAQLQSMRNEILNLILSEHPCSCLICDEKDECKEFSTTIRKVGVTTGCRYCPNDSQCELQDVTKRIGVTELNYPVYYRNLPVEKEDPFYDRDYNLCILCGRCVRICQEIRAANAISFKQRGRHTVIGPAFKRTHMEAGCEFCGACVSVCPTGSLSEKARKWRGKEERAVTTTCPYCGIGCQVNILVRENQVIGALPAEAPMLNNGQLCVKGRFCVTETVNTHHRLLRCHMLEDGVQVEITPEQALTRAAEKLAACPADRFGMVISPNCSNEDLYAAQKFTREAIGSARLDTTAREFYGAGYKAYLGLFRHAASFADIRRAELIICIGLDTLYGRSVVGAELRQAVRRGASVVTIHPRRHNLSVVAGTWLRPAPDAVAVMLDDLAAAIGKAKPSGVTKEAADVARMAGASQATVILVGSEFTNDDNAAAIYSAVARLADAGKAGILPLPVFNNLMGVVITGAQGEPLSGEDKLDVLYVIGENAARYRPLANFVIGQNIYSPEPPDGADLLIPSAAFTEADGTYYNEELHLLKTSACVLPPGDARPDWDILYRLARQMGKSGFEATSLIELQAEMAKEITGFGDFEKTGVLPAAIGKPAGASKSTAKPAKGNGDFPFLLRVALEEHSYRGYPLSHWVGGARILFPLNVVMLHPDDAARIGITNHDSVVVTSGAFERTWPTMVSDAFPAGEAHVAVPPGDVAGGNPHRVTIRKNHV